MKSARVTANGIFLAPVLTSSSGWNISNGHGLSSHWASDIKGLEEEVNICLSVRGKMQSIKELNSFQLCLNLVSLLGFQCIGCLSPEWRSIEKS